ncbi:MAG: putative glycosyltransferase [Rhodocyclales bacterium]|nr:putative glycosyltransferase [Rhodocyclales bacterium]
MNTSTNSFAVMDRRGSISRAAFSTTGIVNTFLDPAVVVMTLFLLAVVRGDDIEAPYVLLGVLAFALCFPGNARLREPWRSTLNNMVINWLMLAGVLLVFGYASGYLDVFANGFIGQWLGILPVATIATHALARKLMPKVMAMEGYRRSAVIVGCNDIGARLAASFQDDPLLGIACEGFFDDRIHDRLDAFGEKTLLGKLDDLAEYIKTRHTDHIYLALPMASQPRILSLLDSLKDTTVSIFFVPDIFVTDIIQGRMDMIHGVPVVSVCETPFTGLNGIAKRCSDIVLASLILMMIAPILLAVAIGVKLTSPGPTIFRQRRYGLDGKEILVYKFRSMKVTEDGAVVKQASRNDDRITPFGAFIRKTSLDELPQFVNVLQGRMSIVGPRPHAVAHNEMYRKLVKGYMVRHKVKPGITGWAQVNGYRGETDTVDKMEKRIEYDLQYLRNWSVALDIKIILRTVGLVANDASAY